MLTAKDVTQIVPRSEPEDDIDVGQPHIGIKEEYPSLHSGQSVP